MIDLVHADGIYFIERHLVIVAIQRSQLNRVKWGALLLLK